MCKFLFISLAFLKLIFATEASADYDLLEGDDGNLGYVLISEAGGVYSQDPLEAGAVRSCAVSRHSSWLSVDNPTSPIVPFRRFVTNDISYVDGTYTSTPSSGVDDEDMQFPAVPRQVLSGVGGRAPHFLDPPELVVLAATLRPQDIERDGIEGGGRPLSELVNRGPRLGERNFRVLPEGRILGGDRGFHVGARASFREIPRIESEDMLPQISEINDDGLSEFFISLSDLAKSGRIGEKLTLEDRRNLHCVFLEAIPHSVQHFPFEQAKYNYSVVRLIGNHSNTQGRKRMSIVEDKEWLTIVRDRQQPNRWVAVETDNTLYAEFARKCDALGLKHIVEDERGVQALRPIRSIRSIRRDQIKTHSAKYYALRWFLKLMEAGENISESEKNSIRGRVKNILGYVFSLTNDEACLFIKTYCSDYGNTCADNAMEGLEQAEFAVAIKGTSEKNVFEAFLNKLKNEFIAGMSVVELYECPTSGIVCSRPRAVGLGESIETKIYLSLLLSEVIDVGHHGHTMLYPKCAYRPRADLVYKFFMQGFSGVYVLESLPLMPVFKEYACDCYVKENRRGFAKVILDDCAEELVTLGKISIDKARFYAYLEQTAQQEGFSEDAADGGVAFYDEIDKLKTNIAKDYAEKMLGEYYTFRH